MIKIRVVDINKNKPYSACISCEDKINTKYPIYNCDNCKGDLCNRCISTHYQHYPNHVYSLAKYVFGTQKSMEIICKLCEKRLEKEQNNICYTCNINLCDTCSNIHIKNNYNHILKFNIRNIPETKSKRDLCIICDKNINLDNFYDYNYCNQCLGNICLSCSKNHENIYKGHYLEPKDESKRLLEDTDEFNKDTSLKSDENSCLTCGVLMTNKINLKSHYCNFCKGYFCSKCIGSHFKLYPKHKKLTLQIDDSNLGISSDNSSKCNLCNKNMKGNESVFYCNQCKITICKECSSNHNNLYATHQIISYKKVPSKLNLKQLKNTSKFNLKTERSDEARQCACIMCNVPHSKYPDRLYYACTDCNNYICNLCKKKHDLKFYSHILINPHKSGEEMKRIKRDKKRFASVGERRGKGRKVLDDTENDNLMTSGYETGGLKNTTSGNFCSQCKKMKYLQICKKCNKFYCLKCIRDIQHICS